MSAGYVYILRSSVNSRYYVGSCVDIERRFQQHNSGLVRSTMKLRPWILEFYQKFENVKMARQVEYRLKKMKSKIILERILQDKIIKLEV